MRLAIDSLHIMELLYFSCYRLGRDNELVFFYRCHNLVVKLPI